MPHIVKLGHTAPATEQGVSVPPVTFSLSTPSDAVTAVQEAPTPTVVAVPRVDFVHDVRTVQAVQTGNSTAFYDEDFTVYTDDAALHAAAGTTTPLRVTADPGVGMKYTFIADPTRCGDQTVSSVVNFPPGTTEFWLRTRVRFSANWTNANPNCTSPQPDYKWLLYWLQKNVTGLKRFDLRPGTANSHWSCLPPGWPTQQNAPISVCQPGRGSPNPMPTSEIWDGQFHDLEVHIKIESGPDRSTYQWRIDSTLICNYTTGYGSNIGLAGNAIDRVNIGANRNLGATEEMYLWWEYMRIWDTDPGDMTFPPPDNY